MRKLFSLILYLAILPASFTAHSSAPAQIRDRWRSVRTNNLFVIGNADDESLREVASWLEYFHTAFARLVSRSPVDSSVPTTVVVFRDQASFTPFKPLYQGRPANVAGYFQPGEDVNYIALSLEAGERDRFATAFHEYVHLHLRDSAPGAPLWLNEGLAEFYSSLKFTGGEVRIGAEIPGYLDILRTSEMLSLKTLFSIGTNSPHYNERDKSGIFYGESWALVHYLMQGDNGQHQEQFKRFLQAVSRGDTSDKTFEDIFGMSLALTEEKLRDYVRRGEVGSHRVMLSGNAESYVSYTAMQRSSLSEGEANYYLGDLLLHINRDADAERYFLQAISLEPSFIPPYASMGLLRVRQRRYAEAKKFLEKATTTQQKYFVHYLYAYVLSREGVGPTGQVQSYSREDVLTIRAQLLRAIQLEPQFAPAYHLLAVVDLVANDQPDEALAMAEKAHQLNPGKTNYSMLLAQIYLRRSDATAARQILESLARDSDTQVRADAQRLLDNISQSQGGAKRSGGETTQVNLGESMLSEPVQPSSRTMIGVGISVGAVRDGQTIENSGPMPALDEVLAQYVKAIGGTDAIKAVTSRVVKGTLDVVGASRNESLESYAIAPNKFLLIMNSEVLGTIKQAYNGQVGWSQNKTGLKTLKGIELSVLEREADIYAGIRLKDNFAKVTLLGKSKIGYREVYVLELQSAGGPSERLFIDAQSFLPARLNAVRFNGTQMAPVEVYFDDWQTVDGVKYPFSVTESFPNLTLVLKLKEIRHGLSVDSRLFDPPRK